MKAALAATPQIASAASAWPNVDSFFESPPQSGFGLSNLISQLMHQHLSAQVSDAHPLASLLSGISNAASGAYKAAVPVNARILLDTIGGNTSPITEKDFSPNELKALVDAVNHTKQLNSISEQSYRNAISVPEADYMKHPQSELVETAPGSYHNIPGGKSYAKYLQENQAALSSYNKDRSKTSVDYYSYANHPGAAPTFDGPVGAIWKSYTDPEYRMKTTLGSFNAYDSPEAMHIRDKYNFDAHDYYSMIKNIDTNKAGVVDMLKASNGPVEFFDMYMQRYHPNTSRDVNITIPNQQ